MGRTGNKVGEELARRPAGGPPPGPLQGNPLGEGAVEIDARGAEIQRALLELERAKGITERPLVQADLSDDIASRASFISALASRSVSRASGPDGGGLITSFEMEDEAARCLNLEGDLIAWTDMDKRHKGADLVVLQDPPPALAEFLEREEVSVRKGEPVWGPSESPLPEDIREMFEDSAIRIQVKTSDAFSSSRYGMEYEILHQHRFGRMGNKAGKLNRDNVIGLLRETLTHMRSYDRSLACWYQGHEDSEGNVSLVARMADIPQGEVEEALEQLLTELEDLRRINPQMKLISKTRIRQLEEYLDVSIKTNRHGNLEIAALHPELVTPSGNPAQRWSVSLASDSVNMFVHGDDLEMHGGWSHKPPPSDRSRVRGFVDTIRETEDRLRRHLAGEKVGRGGWERSIRTTREKLAGIS